MTELKRVTKETDIKVKVEVEGRGVYAVSTGIGFFDHMLESLSKHSGIDIEIECRGDIHVDYHHTVEDVGIVLGEALCKEIYPVKNVARFGDAVVVMDESAVECAIDLSNRPYLVYDLGLDGNIKDFDCELFEEFFRAFAFNAKITLHLHKKRGRNRHHIAEASFKALALALKRALKKDDKTGIPSTKGLI